MMRTAVLLFAAMLGSIGCARKVPAPPPPPPVAAPPPTPRKSTPKPRTAEPRTAAPAPAPKPPRTESATPPAPPAATPPPILGEIVDPNNQAEIERAIQSSLERAQQNIARLHQRSPTPEQLRGIAQVETFIRQAQDARRTNDFSNARSLAERADVLSQDLLRAR